jgi:Periplasmic molybdate-binding protein/domain
VAGPTERDVETVELGGWSREWGLVVSPGNPAGIESVADLVDRDLRFVNRNRESGLRASLAAAVSELADRRDGTATELTDAIDGFELTRRAHESPARMVEAGDADAGLGLRASSEALGLGFVPLGTQRVRALANPDRTEKAGVRDLETTIADGGTLDVLDGFER